MPSTARELLAAAGLTPMGCVPWGEKPRSGSPGVYVVTLCSDADGTGAALPECPVDHERVAAWLEDLPEMTLDGRRPSVGELAARLAAFWLPDEVVLYIGQTGESLRKRVGAYYRTPLGDPRPHAGGYFLKTLSVLPALTVHYAETDDPEGAEEVMISRFAGGVSAATRAALHDPDHPFPFANLELRIRKRHGLRKTRKPRR